MSNKLQPVRGTKDILPEENELFSHVLHTAKRIGNLYGFETISTPIFEFTEVFKRTLGDTSDVVNKEMYTFEDRGGESITLRPEFTAGIARAFISNGLQQNLPLKLFSAGPLFRYERPQKGRQRQFHQVNFEVIGIDNPAADVELIVLAKQILNELGIDNGLTLELNTLGDAESREKYTNDLVAYLEVHKDKLSEDSQRRLKENPLRILDSKDDADKEIIKNAPEIESSLSDEAKKFFEKVKAGLDALGIEYHINPKIVRGLDYYTHTVFEFVVSSDEMGSQNTVLAGGRYDGLISQMGGPETPAVGFAAGIERLCLIAKKPESNKPKIALIGMGDLEQEVLKLAIELRSSKQSIDIIYGGNPKKKFAKADKQGCTHVLVLGEDEIKNNTVTLKDLSKGEQTEIARDKVTETIQSLN